ncbi:hypothetical protein J3R82DRAFT_3612 [Butyriboletus roseoflavus]|nr:hypothetical protein J3R82DRAFT_3612 [Butyriboletus roseoflavus]
MSRPPVPLPSIRDIFPGEPTALPQPLASSQGQSRNVHTAPKTPQPHLSLPGKPFLPPPPPLYPQSQTRTQHLPLSPPRAHFRLHHPPPSPPPSSSSSESATRPLPSSKQPSYSFNVLRADPVTSSLEHVASSTTLRPRAPSASTPSHPGMHGSAPVFRVAMSPAEPRPTRHRPPRPIREILPDTRERHHPRDPLSPSIPREADLAHLRSPTSAILSFPVSDHPVSTTSALITTDGRRLHLRSEIPGAALQGEGRGKKHQCPHCGKRFNRPSSMKIHVNTHTGAKPYRCPFPGCGREFNVNSNMRRHWRNHSRSAPLRLPDSDVTRNGVYHHHARLDGLPHHALMSPPATNSSVSEGNSDDEYSDDDVDGYAMDVDVDDCEVGPRGDGEGDEGMRDAPHPPPPPHPIKGSAGSSSSSDDSVWSRSVSPARGPASPSGYGPQLHRPRQDQQGHQSPLSHSSHSHGHQTSECIYRPSIAAYAISCTDSRVSTALRPAFTSSSSCTVRDRDRDRERDRYHARPMSGSGREREKRHGQGYLSRG